MKCWGMPMSKRTLSIVVVIGVASLSCEPVPLTAPAGSTIFLQANPGFVPANGGRSLVTALLTEPAGTLVSDGTEVTFITTLGTIDQTATTRNGIARVYFVADARSGQATVTAISGGEAPAANPTPTPTPTNLTSLTPLAASATGNGTATVDITVGSASPARVVLGANPQRITSSRRSTLTATVFDESGNPVQNVPVIFQITSMDAGAAATLDSGGLPRFTDSSGQAFDTLFTAAPTGGTQKEVQIVATTANDRSSESLTVFID
jgi:hypothetical protein